MPGRRISVAAFVAAVLTLQLVFVPSVVAADYASCSSDQSHWAGLKFTVSGQQKHGVSGTIEGQTLHQCSNPGPLETNGTWAWSALGDAGGPNTIMQVGMGRCREPLNPDCTWNMEFYETWGIDPEAPGCTGWARTLPTPFKQGTWDAASHDYKIYHQSNQWKFLVGSTVIHTQPEADICWTPTIAWWFNETWDSGDALGGSATNHLRTSLMNYAKQENGPFYWTSFNASSPCTYDPGAPRYCDIIDGKTYDAWTDR